MPNHITNIVEIASTGNTGMKEIRAAFLNAEGQVDFDVVIPSPKCLDNFEPHSGIINLAAAILETPLSGNDLLAAMQKESRREALAKRDKMSEADMAMVDRAISNHKECGYLYWHDWQRDKWGTKWNAYSQPKEGFPEEATAFTFDTAWSHPSAIIETLSQKLPDVTFSIRYADEDTGSNCGTYTIKDGAVSKANIAPTWSEMTPEQRRQYTELAFNVRYEGVDPRSHGYDENWEYSEEVEEAYWYKKVDDPALFLGHRGVYHRISSQVRARSRNGREKVVYKTRCGLTFFAPKVVTKDPDSYNFCQCCSS